MRVLNSSFFVKGLIVIAVISFVILGYRSLGFFVVSRSCLDVEEVIVMVDDVSESINVEDGVSEEMAVQIVAQIEDTLAVIGKNRGDQQVVLRIVSPDLYRSENELFKVSESYIRYARDLAVRCLQGEDTWDDIGILREKHEKYMSSQDDYFEVVSSVRTLFLLGM